MKLELNKTYITKRNIPVKITMKTSWGFFGTLQDDSKLSVRYSEAGKVVKYTETGKVVGWSTGNFLDIQGSDEIEEVPPAKNAFKEKYEAREQKIAEAKQVQEKKEESEAEPEVEETKEDSTR